MFLKYLDNSRSDTSISFVIPGELKEVAVQEIKKAYQL